MAEKMALCGNPKAKDSNIRAAIIDRFGGADVALARRTKCKPTIGRGKERMECPACSGSGWKGADGPLASVTSHAWPALAVALTYCDAEVAAALGGTA